MAQDDAAAVDVALKDISFGGGEFQGLVAEAKEYLPARVQDLANVHKFKFINVKITSAQTRWGSCTFKNSINFSCFIMRLPSELIDFIIVHELCHTVHKNHGPKFHQLLDYCSDGKKKDFEKELKKYRIR